MSGEGRDGLGLTHLRADGRAMGRTAACVWLGRRNVTLADGVLRVVHGPRSRAEHGSEENTRKNEWHKAPRPSPPEHSGLSRGGWRRKPADAARPRQGQGPKSHTVTPPARRSARRGHTRPARRLARSAHRRRAGRRRRGKGKGLYLYAGVGRGYHAACLVSSSPLAQI